MKRINIIAFVLTMLISVVGIVAIEYSEKTQKILERIKESGTQNEKDLAVKLYAGKIGDADFKSRMNLLNEYRAQIERLSCNKKVFDGDINISPFAAAAVGALLVEQAMRRALRDYVINRKIKRRIRENETQEKKSFVVKLVDGEVDEADFKSRINLLSEYREQIENGTQKEKDFAVKLVEFEIDKACFKMRMGLLYVYREQIERLDCKPQVFDGSYVGHDIEMKYAISMFHEGVKAYNGKQMEKWGREYHRLYMSCNIDSDKIDTTPADVLYRQKGSCYKGYYYNELISINYEVVIRRFVCSESFDETFISHKEWPEYLYEHIANCSDGNKCREMLRAAESLGFDFSNKIISYGKAITLERFSVDNKIFCKEYSFKNAITGISCKYCDEKKGVFEQCKNCINKKKKCDSIIEIGYESYDKFIFDKLMSNPLWKCISFSSDSHVYPYTYKSGESINIMDFAVFANNIPLVTILDEEYGIKIKVKHLDRAFNVCWWENRDKENKRFFPKLLKLSSKNNKDLLLDLVENKNDKLKNSEALIKIYLYQKEEAIKPDKLKQLEEVAIKRMDRVCIIGEYGEILRGLKPDEEMAEARNSKRCKEAKKIHALLLEHVKQAEAAKKQ